ncbi:MAG: SLC13 family permease [bacterium]|nr:SLC13 family permease [bacterium]
MPNFELTFFSLLSLIVLSIVYFFLISEKLNKVIVSMLGAVFLIFMQVFRTLSHSSQENAFQFISHNLDILFFVIGMMILVGIVRDSGIFEAVAIWIVKTVRGKPKLLLISLGYLTLFMTTLFSNIPTILIMVPVILILVRSLKLPYLPYLFTIVMMANLGGAMTPISDPTTYYQAKTVGLGFMEVVSNSGAIVLLLSVVTLAYTLWIFRKPLAAVKVSASAVAQFKPSSALGNRRVLYRGTPILFLAIFLMMGKEWIKSKTGIAIDNATVTLGAAFFCMLIFHREPKKVFRDLIDWEIIFFFMGLFVVVGALEFTRVIELLAHGLVQISNGSIVILTLLMTTGSALLSTFIDNVPYNITMVGAIQAMEKSGIVVYPLWWALNLGTSIGGAGSPIAAACNVIAFGQAEKEGYKTGFLQYLKLALPLVVLNSLITFGVLWIKFL